MTELADVTVKPPTRFTGWIRYRVASRGSSGTYTWIYAPGWDEQSDQEIADYIIDSHESWARHAEYCRVEWHVGELPPAKTIQAHIAGRERSKVVLDEEIKTLQQQYIHATTELTSI